MKVEKNPVVELSLGKIPKGGERVVFLVSDEGVPKVVRGVVDPPQHDAWLSTLVRVLVDDGAHEFVRNGSLMKEEDYLKLLDGVLRSKPAADVEADPFDFAGQKVDPFVFRMWLIENMGIEEERVGLNFLTRFFREFEVFVSEEDLSDVG